MGVLTHDMGIELFQYEGMWFTRRQKIKAISFISCTAEWWIDHDPEKMMTPGILKLCRDHLWISGVPDEFAVYQYSKSSKGFFRSSCCAVFLRTQESGLAEFLAIPCKYINSLFRWNKKILGKKIKFEWPGRGQCFSKDKTFHCMDRHLGASVPILFGWWDKEKFNMSTNFSVVIAQHESSLKLARLRRIFFIYRWESKTHQ